MSYIDHIKPVSGIGSGKYDSYFPIYERYFSRWRGRSPTVLEIGVEDGSSLMLWRTYFGSGASIFGIDIRPECSVPDEASAALFIGDQSDPKFLEKILSVTGPLDIVIDDGSHKSEDIWTSFSIIYPRMSKHGIYLVEDTHVAGAFIEKASRMTPRLTALLTTPEDSFRTSTLGMHFYESVVVFERGFCGAEASQLTRSANIK